MVTALVDTSQYVIEEAIVRIAENETKPIDLYVLAEKIKLEMGSFSALYFRPAILHLLENGTIDITLNRKVILK